MLFFVWCKRTLQLLCPPIPFWFTRTIDAFTQSSPQTLHNSSLELDCIWIIYQKLRNKEQAFWFHMKIFFGYTWSPFVRPVWDFFFFFIRLVENTAHSTLYAPLFQKNHPQRAKLCRLEEIKVHFPWDSWCGFVFSFSLILLLFWQGLSEKVSDFFPADSYFWWY